MRTHTQPFVSNNCVQLQVYSPQGASRGNLSSADKNFYVSFFFFLPFYIHSFLPLFFFFPYSLPTSLLLSSFLLSFSSFFLSQALFLSLPSLLSSFLPLFIFLCTPIFTAA
jgi:hypothetical protein